MNTMKKNGGFTLVELIIVIAILAILSTGAIAGYSAYIKSANNAAVEAVLSDISTSAVLANAKAGAVSNIVVEKDDSGTSAKLKITVTATNNNFAPDFDTLFIGSLNATNTTQSGATSHTFTISLPSAWDNSEYAEGNNAGAYWNGHAWSVGTTAPTTGENG